MLSDKTFNFSSLMTQDKATDRAIERAHHCIKHGYDTIWIEGESGTGKSLLANMICSEQIKQNKIDNVDVISISAPTRASLESLTHSNTTPAYHDSA